MTGHSCIWPRALTLPIALASLLGACAIAGASDLSADLRGFLAPDFLHEKVQAAAVPAFLPAFLPPVELRSLLRMIHLVGLCLGFGTAMTLDGTALAWLRSGRAPVHASEHLEVGGRIVLVGFALLWASGVALTWLAVLADPAFLTNPKIWAKVVVVTALTVNAFMLHIRVLPTFSRSLGRSIDGRWRKRERVSFVACGAVSGASWVLAFALGVLREWNYAASFAAIMALWLIGMALAAAAILLLMPAGRGAARYEGPDRRGAV
ncbi:hypothetical protein [Aureimonas pseudogalii]|uniref:DUF2306 domain-containing protein n=1 Tax=Aureimonas pseudogalii TaxID=1744844 RepID=A0A7W6E961_9HYPH|nr:hypothetical protein [Aureimonas pseudogalii]MBB3997056.1 hypothetical protein [Aureimonas pseudogalii]